MNNEGFGSNGAAFEYAIPREGKTRTSRRALLIVAYVAWVMIFFTVGVLTRLALPLLCFIPLSLWILVFLTWRWTKEEIKLSFLGGGVTVTRMYDGRNPKKLYEARIKSLRQITDCTPKKLEQYEKSGRHQILYAIRGDHPEGACLAVWDGQVLIFEANEKALKIIKYYCEGEVYDVRGEKGAGLGVFGQNGNDWH